MLGRIGVSGPHVRRRVVMVHKLGLERVIILYHKMAVNHAKDRILKKENAILLRAVSNSNCLISINLK